MSRLRPSHALPLVLLVLLAFAVSAAAPGAPQPVVVNVQEFEFGIEPSGLVLIPGENVTLHITNTGAVGHNLYIGDGGSIAKWDPIINPGDSANLTFTVPDSGVNVFYCNVQGHRELGMQGNLTVKGTQVASAAGPKAPGDVRVLGVEFFAYWVGVVSFVVLFLVIAATFFLLRYGETKHWTDWRDRPAREKEGEAPKAPMGTYVALAIVLLVFVVAAVQVLRVV
jgi:plastocyanin